MKLKKVISILMVAVMSLSLMACSTKKDESKGDDKSDKEVSITYANFNASGGHEEVLENMYKEFQKEYPNIKVEIENIGYDNYFTQMQTRVAGGTAPDCYELNIENFSAYANKGVLAEIKDVDVSGFNQTALEAFNISGKQYGLPGNFSNVVLVYNKDLFDKAGVSYPTNDWTWDDANAAAEKIRALGSDIYGIMAPITYNEFYKVSAQYGGSLLNKDKTKFTINSDENVKAAEMMVNRVIKSNVQPTEKQLGRVKDWDLFESGRLGMIPTGIWAFTEFTEACKFNWDIAVEPGEAKKATHFFSNALVINADSKNKEAAATWINWLASSPKSSEMRIAAGWDLPAIKDESILNKYLEVTPPDNKKAVFESVDYLVMPPVIEDYTMMSDIITDKLTKASTGEITAKEALDEAQKECESKIKLS